MFYIYIYIYIYNHPYEQNLKDVSVCRALFFLYVVYILLYVVYFLIKKKFNNKKIYFERFGKFHSAHRQTAHVLKLKTEIPITYIYIYIYTHTLSHSLFFDMCVRTRGSLDLVHFRHVTLFTLFLHSHF